MKTPLPKLARTLLLDSMKDQRNDRKAGNGVNEIIRRLMSNFWEMKSFPNHSRSKMCQGIDWKGSSIIHCLQTGHQPLSGFSVVFRVMRQFLKVLPGNSLLEPISANHFLSTHEFSTEDNGEP